MSLSKVTTMTAGMIYGGGLHRHCTLNWEEMTSPLRTNLSSTSLLQRYRGVVQSEQYHCIVVVFAQRQWAIITNPNAQGCVFGFVFCGAFFFSETMVSSSCSNKRLSLDTVL